MGLVAAGRHQHRSVQQAYAALLGNRRFDVEFDLRPHPRRASKPPEDDDQDPQRHERFETQNEGLAGQRGHLCLGQAQPPLGTACKGHGELGLGGLGLLLPDPLSGRLFRRTSFDGFRRFIRSRFFLERIHDPGDFFVGRHGHLVKEELQIPIFGFSIAPEGLAQTQEAGPIIQPITGAQGFHQVQIISDAELKAPLDEVQKQALQTQVLLHGRSRFIHRRRAGCRYRGLASS